MKRLLVANKQVDNRLRYTHGNMELMLKAQIENLLELGWKIEDLILLCNFDFEFMGVKGTQIPFNEFCLTGSKMFALKWLMDNQLTDEVVYSADLDAWQSVFFDCPEFEGDVGACQYSNPKWNGGSIFWKPSSKDIVEKVVETIQKEEAPKEEPVLNRIFRMPEYINRITKLDYTYNVGCSGFTPRYSRSIKPLRVCHFHPFNSIAWEMHALDREDLGEIAITVRLERLLRRYFEGLAVQLSAKTIRRQQQIKELGYNPKDRKRGKKQKK